MAKKSTQKKPRRSMAQQIVLSHRASEFNRLGPSRLGRLLNRYGVPMQQDGEVASQLGQSMGIDCADLTDAVMFYDYDDDVLPITSTRFSSIFNTDRTLAGCGSDEDDEGEDCQVRRTNIDCGNQFSCPFLMTGLCIVGTADSELFSYYAVHNPTAPAANSEMPNIPPVDVDSNEATHAGGVFGLVPNLAAIAPAGNWSHAQVGVGWPAWRGIENYLLGTRLDITVCNKLELLSEMLATMGMCLMNPGFQGAGSAGIPTGPFTRCLNDRLAEIGQGVALQVNVTDDEASTVCLPPQIVYFMKGATESPGIAGKPYMLNQPAFFSSMMSPKFTFHNVVDENCVCPLESILTVTKQSPQANYLQDVSGITNSCGGNTFLPYGRMSIGILLFGFEMSPMAVASWIASMCSISSPQVAGIRELHGTTDGRAYLRTVHEQAEARWGRDPKATRGEKARFNQLHGFLNGLPGSI